MWKTKLFNVSRTMTSSPSSVSDTRSCLSIFSLWFTNLYSKASQIAFFCIAISRVATKWRRSHSDYRCTGSDA
ncbi:hypothetical protein E2C01_058731 [Portunus trituberculatus]|uniref:Uncharacterized protein n=1 Tax=Portunus trituberculatus TaxID=210409 RepID=A0A5B7H3I5_PORTR|nr:hypothetical protein [Portunus trituberculatus]